MSERITEPTKENFAEWNKQRARETKEASKRLVRVQLPGFKRGQPEYMHVERSIANAHGVHDGQKISRALATKLALATLGGAETYLKELSERFPSTQQPDKTLPLRARRSPEKTVPRK